MDARQSSDACRFLSGRLGSEIQTGASLHPPLPFSSLFSWAAPDQGGGRGHRGQILSSFRICFHSPNRGFHSTNVNFDQVVSPCPPLPCPGSHLLVGSLNICENSWTVCHLVTSFSPLVLLQKAFCSLESQLLFPTSLPCLCLF